MSKAEKSKANLEEALRELQEALATIDFNDAIATPPTSDVTYLLIKVFQRIRIRMDGNKNHGRPHVHIDYGKKFHVASYAIRPAVRIVGELARKYDVAVCGWIAKHQTNLMEAWSLMQAGRDARSIAIELQGS
jgi:hypothetical protein